MPLFQARKSLLVKTRLAVDETIKSIADLASYWPLQEANAHGPELIVDGDMELPQYGADLVDNGTFDPLYGPEELVDGDMEAVGTAVWTSGNSATLTKETGTPHGGTQVLRIARNAVNNPNGRQDPVFTIGEHYRVAGWTRSDGNAVPEFFHNAVALFIGTTSTDWQFFDIEFEAEATTVIFRSTTSIGVEYTEWDDITVVEVNPEWTLGDGWSIGSALELYAGPDAASDPAGNEADGTIGWGARTGATLTSDGVIKDVGDYSIKGVFVSPGAGIYFDLDTILTTGKRYTLNFKTRHLGSGGLVNSYLAATEGGTDTLLVSLDNTDTTFQTVELEFTHSGLTRYLTGREMSGTEDGGIYFDNISILELPTAHCDGSQVAVTNLTQDILVVGRTYEISWDISNYQAGNVAALAGTAISSLKAADGSYTEQVLATATIVGGVQGDATFLGDVDNVIVKEVITLTNWDAEADAILTKETVDPYEGLQVLRIARSISNDPRAVQTIMVIGKRYLVTGRARSDGNAEPTIVSGGDTLFTGTISTDWQEFDFERTATSTKITFRADTSVDTQFTEWDAISVVELIPEGGGNVVYATNPERLLGRNVVLEGNFPNDPGVWILGAGWAIAGGKAIATATTNAADLQQNSLMETGKTYEITYTISNYSAGQIRIRAGATIGTTRAGDGTFTETLTASAPGHLRFSTIVGQDFTGKINNVTAQQTDIAASNTFSGAEELDESGASGTATAVNYIAGSGATLTNPSVGILQNVCSVADVSTQARQSSVMTIGKRYLFSGEAKGDGVNGSPTVADTTVALKVGTTSTDWQNMDVEFVATTDQIRFNTTGDNATEDTTQWRNLSVVEVNPLNGVSVAAIIGQLAGLLGLAYLFDGIVAYINLLSAELNSIFNSESGGVGGFIHANSAAWTDGLSRYFLYFYVDSDNFISISKHTTDDSLFIQVKMGGTDRSVLVDVNGPDQFIHAFVTWTQDEIVILIDGFVVATLLGAGDWIGNLTIALIAAKSTAPIEPFYGYLCHVPLFSSAPSIYDVKRIAESGGIIGAPTVSVSGASGFSSGFSSGFE